MFDSEARKKINPNHFTELKEKSPNPSLPLVLNECKPPNFPATPPQLLNGHSLKGVEFYVSPKITSLGPDRPNFDKF